ncbi:hypothetical protein H4R21_002779 [Coemansia helicoidea]|uniref:Uncharacterized protein n=1 Tax=Coemansia helicoidea TaxID=1286919 RepID=A0ACC1L4Z1_9FUNG|nr:hypothetical protein H4R21_002779 [Coemansia helicoidea]
MSIRAFSRGLRARRALALALARARAIADKVGHARRSARAQAPSPAAPSPADVQAGHAGKPAELAELANAHAAQLCASKSVAEAALAKVERLAHTVRLLDAQQNTRETAVRPSPAGLDKTAERIDRLESFVHELQQRCAAAEQALAAAVRTDKSDGAPAKDDRTQRQVALAYALVAAEASTQAQAEHNSRLEAELQQLRAEAGMLSPPLICAHLAHIEELEDDLCECTASTKRLVQEIEDIMASRKARAARDEARRAEAAQA